MSATTGAIVAERAPRLAVIDVLKGVAIVAMIVYHFAWDLSAYQLIGVDVTNELGWRIFARTIAGTFLALVGINLVLALRNGFRPRPYFRRLAIILAAALLVSGATYYLFGPGGFVYFGILHLIFVASVLALPFLFLPAWTMLPASVFFLVGARFMTSPTFDSLPWYWLGLSPNPQASFDYVPLFPWFGVVLVGVFAGRQLVARPGLRLWQWRPTALSWKALAVAGRWSLLIYLLHQIVLYPLVGWVAPLIGPSQAAMTREFVAHTEMRCGAAGYSPTPCQAFALCVAEAIGSDPRFLSDYRQGALTEADSERLVEAESLCQNRFLLTEPEGGI